MAAIAVIAAVAAVVFVTLWFLQSSSKRKAIDKLTGPPALPLIGNAHQLSTKGSDFYAQLIKFSEEFKDAGMFRVWLGVTPCIALYRGELCEVVLNSTKHMEKSFFYKFLHPWLGTGLLTSKGAKWHSRRKMLTPTFHFKILSDFLTVFSEQSETLKEKLRAKAGEKQFNIFPYITLCALDIICETAMGRKVNAQNNQDSEYVQAVYQMSTIVLNRFKAPWYWPDLLFNTFGQGSDHDKCLHVLHDFTKQVIQEKKQGMSGPSEPEEDGRKKRLAFMDMLLHMSDGGKSLSDEDIREEVDTFMFEGHDTTAAAMNWAVYLIGRDKNVQQKVHEEMDAIFGDSERAMSTEDLKEMKYLECCVKEALRLYPSVPMFARCLSEDAEIGGYMIPKDTTAVVLTTALHRDPRYFPQPEEFRPERFLSENQKTRHPYAYVPFSAGMRNCIGQKFAMMEEKAVLSTIFRNFSVTSHQKREDLHPVGDLILRPEDGITVTLANRRE